MFYFFSVLDKIIVQGYKALQLQYFFTAGPDEVKAWTIQVKYLLLLFFYSTQTLVAEQLKNCHHQVLAINLNLKRYKRSTYVN
jgi:hypothetical protein